MREATRLAAQGKYKCRVCGKIDDQDNGVVIAFLGNVLLAVCPRCITGPIILERLPTGIQIHMSTPRQSSLILPGDLSPTGLHVAQPKVTKIKL